MATVSTFLTDLHREKSALGFRPCLFHGINSFPFLPELGTRERDRYTMAQGHQLSKPGINEVRLQGLKTNSWIHSQLNCKQTNTHTHPAMCFKVVAVIIC